MIKLLTLSQISQDDAIAFIGGEIKENGTLKNPENQPGRREDTFG